MVAPRGPRLVRRPEGDVTIRHLVRALAYHVDRADQYGEGDLARELELIRQRVRSIAVTHFAYDPEEI